MGVVCLRVEDLVGSVETDLGPGVATPGEDRLVEREEERRPPGSTLNTDEVACLHGERVLHENPRHLCDPGIGHPASLDFFALNFACSALATHAGTNFDTSPP